MVSLHLADLKVNLMVDHLDCYMAEQIELKAIEYVYLPAK